MQDVLVKSKEYVSYYHDSWCTASKTVYLQYHQTLVRPWVILDDDDFKYLLLSYNYMIKVI